VRGAGWLGKRVRVFAGWDHQKQYSPMVEGEIVGYIDGPSVIVRDAAGHENAWPVSLPMEELPARDLADRRTS
jgi:hypothetical protein